MKPRYPAAAAVVLAAITLAAAGARLFARQEPQGGQPFRFRTGVELVNVTATVTDDSGRFVAGLRKEDFRVYQDGELQEITHFNAERVPVSLGIVLDTSGSMDGEKMLAARGALNRFLLELLGDEDEVFLYRFDSTPELVHGWTTDRRRVSRALESIRPRGGTAMYDALAEAVPLAQSGRHRKKALVIISDGNDTSSRTAVEALVAQIRESELLVYAIGIDAQVTANVPGAWRGGLVNASFEQRPRPVPFPRPGRPTPPPTRPVPPTGPGTRFPPILPPARPPVTNPRSPNRVASSERVNVVALREITDDSGGRTEVVRSAYDLGPATAGIADELSRQYFLGYSSNTPKDGRWHAIRVEVQGGRYHVRARRGFVATP